jgi:hypothetical protein
VAGRRAASAQLGTYALAAALDRVARDVALRRRLHEGGLSTSGRFGPEALSLAIEECLLELMS